MRHDLTQTMNAKVTEAERLKKENESLSKENQQLKQQVDDVEVYKVQAKQFYADFETERRDRVVAKGKHDEEIAQWQIRYQKLQEERIHDQEVFQKTHDAFQQTRIREQEAFQEIQRTLEAEIRRLMQENESQKSRLDSMKSVSTAQPLNRARTL